MCGRYLLFSKIQSITEHFGLEADDSGFTEAQYNVAPGMFMPAIVRSKKGQSILASMKWGLLPPWSKEEQTGYKMINARAETLEEKKSFATPFQRQRCIIPANGFYEWMHVGSRKIPHLIRVSDAEIIGFAGIYEKWKAPNGDIIPTFSIITTGANDLLKPLHERMPVILQQEEYSLWLDKHPEQQEHRKDLLRPFPMEKMLVYRVGQEVNTAGTNKPELIDPID